MREALQKLTSHPYLLQFMSNLNCNTMKNEEKITLSEAENKRLNEVRKLFLNFARNLNLCFLHSQY